MVDNYLWLCIFLGGHVCCYQCITEWIDEQTTASKSPTCPECRAKIKQKKLVKCLALDNLVEDVCLAEFGEGNNEYLNRKKQYELWLKEYKNKKQLKRKKKFTPVRPRINNHRNSVCYYEYMFLSQYISVLFSFSKLNLGGTNQDFQ